MNPDLDTGHNTSAPAHWGEFKNANFTGPNQTSAHTVSQKENADGRPWEARGLRGARQEGGLPGGPGARRFLHVALSTSRSLIRDP